MFSEEDNEYYNGNGIWIPFEILQNSELTNTEKILYAEIYYLDRPMKHCYASNDYLAKFLGISESGVKKCLSHLKDLGFIQTIAFDGRTRVLATTVKWANKTDTPVSSREIHECTSEVHKNEKLHYIENKKENNIEAQAEPVPSKKHSQIYQERKSLSDDLTSGKEIDNYNTSKKLSPKEKFKKNCLDEINKLPYDDNTKQLLIDYFNFASTSKNVRKVKDLDGWKSKLDDLAKLVEEGYNPADVVKQSLTNQWYKFVEVNTQQNKKNNKGDENVISQRLTREEAVAEIERRKQSGVKGY